MWGVFGESGDYSAHNTWLVAVYPNREQAQASADVLTKDTVRVMAEAEVLIDEHGYADRELVNPLDPWWLEYETISRWHPPEYTVVEVSVGLTFGGKTVKEER